MLAFALSLAACAVSAELPSIRATDSHFAETDQQFPTGLGVPDELRNAAAGEKRPSRNGGFWESPSGS